MDAKQYKKVAMLVLDELSKAVEGAAKPLADINELNATLFDVLVFGRTCRLHLLKAVELEKEGMGKTADSELAFLETIIAKRRLNNE